LDLAFRILPLIDLGEDHDREQQGKSCEGELEHGVPPMNCRRLRRERRGASNLGRAARGRK
jgi:hypothetical protein